MIVKDVVEITSHRNGLVLSTTSGVDILIEPNSSPAYINIISLLRKDDTLEVCVEINWED